MDVILTQDIAGLGMAGEIKSVADGYGRNYLIPRGLAILATKSALKQMAEIQRAAEKRRARQRGSAQILAEKLSGLTLTFTVKVGEGDRLYGSITSPRPSSKPQGKKWIGVASCWIAPSRRWAIIRYRSD